jgi:hypothetical protein
VRGSCLRLIRRLYDSPPDLVTIEKFIQRAEKKKKLEGEKKEGKIFENT